MEREAAKRAEELQDRAIREQALCPEGYKKKMFSSKCKKCGRVKEDHRPLHPSEAALTELEARIAAMARKLVESETSVRMLQAQVEEMTLLQWSKDQRAIEALRMELGQARKDRAGVEKVAVPGGEVPSTILHDDGEHKVDAVNEDQVGVVLADETQVRLSRNITLCMNLRPPSTHTTTTNIHPTRPQDNPEYTKLLEKCETKLAYWVRSKISARDRTLSLSKSVLCHSPQRILVSCNILRS